jgi:hypothetical protein
MLLAFSLCPALPGLGVAVIGSVVPPPRLVESSDDNSDENDDEATQPHLADRTLSTPSASAQLNLDVSAMIA